jgi:tellurite resistance protein
MKQVRRSYTDFNEFVKNEPELVESLIQMINENSEEEVTELVTYNWRSVKYEPMTEIGNIIGLIQDWGDYDKEIDSLYITKTYTMSTDDNKFDLEVIGSSYLKDQCICDEEMSDEITVIDNEVLKIQVEAEKVIKSEKKKVENAKKWADFIKESHLNLEEILEHLSNNYTFPSKIK